MKGIGTYLLSVCGAALLISFCLSLAIGQKSKKILQFVGGLVLVLTVVAPVVKLDPDTLARAVSKAHIEANMSGTGVEVKNKELISVLIKEQCVSYILDKAAQWELDLEIEVIMNEEQGYPFPVGVNICGKVPDTAKKFLSDMIASDLGITKDRQEWK